MCYTGYFGKTINGGPVTFSNVTLTECPNTNTCATFEYIQLITHFVRGGCWKDDIDCSIIEFPKLGSGPIYGWKVSSCFLEAAVASFSTK